MRRERARMMTTGVTSYVLASSSSSSSSNGTTPAAVMLIPLGGALWILEDLGHATPRKLVECNTGTDGNNILPEHAPLLDAKLSRDGSTVAFVCDKEVYVMSTRETDSGVPKQVTTGARGIDGLTNGVADYVAQEELERPDGFWLSPCGTHLVFEQVDESHIPPYRITHQGQDKGCVPTLDTSITSCADVAKEAMVTYEEHRYPFAGAQNPKFRLGLVSTCDEDPTTTTTTTTNNDDAVVWFDLEQVFGDDYYLAKVEWLEPEGGVESTKLIVQLLDRRQIQWRRRQRLQITIVQESEWLFFVQIELTTYYCLAAKRALFALVA